MAQIRHRVDLTKSDFPLLTQDMGRSVLVSSFKDAPSGEAANTPQIMYMHNVMPSKTGLISVGYTKRIAAVTGAEANTNFDHVHIIFSEQGNRCQLGMTSDGHAFILEIGDTVWNHVAAHPAIGSVPTTTGTVNGVTYIHLRGVGTWTYNDVTNALTSVTLVGLVGTILGISASFGYLIAYTATAIAWSSTVNPLDFTPSPVTGAGGGNVSDIEGNILFIVPNSLGLLIYTYANVVAATYTGNKQYPFKFRGVDNSKGALDIDQVTYEANSADHFAYTKGGLQTVNSRTAKSILPELTDFLSGKQLEDFNEATKTFSLTDLTTTMQKKTKLIASRYLIISYGITEFTHAIIYDIVLQKIGKIRHTHTDVFEYINNQIEVSRESIGFLIKDGTIKTLDFSIPASSRTGVLLLGKYQYSRDRHLVMQGITVENVVATDSFSCTDFVSLDGINTSSSLTPVETVGTRSRTYKLLASGINHSLLFIGRFNLSTIQLLMSVGGRR